MIPGQAALFAAKQARQDSAECEVSALKARYITSMTGQDIAEQFDTDAVTAAIRIGDPTLIGELALMCLDQLAERMAVREVYGHDAVQFKDDQIGLDMVAAYVAKRAGVTQ